MGRGLQSPFTYALALTCLAATVLWPGASASALTNSNFRAGVSVQAEESPTPLPEPPPPTPTFSYPTPAATNFFVPRYITTQDVPGDPTGRVKGAALRGKVRDYQEQGIGAMRVMVWTVGAGYKETATTVTAADGTYAFVGLTPGVYSVVVDGYSGLPAENIYLPDGKTVILDFIEAEIPGTVAPSPLLPSPSPTATTTPQQTVTATAPAPGATGTPTPTVAVTPGTVKVISTEVVATPRPVAKATATPAPLLSLLSFDLSFDSWGRALLLGGAIAYLMALLGIVLIKLRG